VSFTIFEQSIFLEAISQRRAAREKAKKICDKKLVKQKWVIG